jgi:hypothetical protein
MLLTTQPRTRRLATIVAGLFILLILIALAAVLVGRALRPASTVQAQRFPGQRMHDALGLFSVTTPPGWKVTGSRTYGSSVGTNSTGTIPLTTEDYYFHDQQPGDTSATVHVSVIAINNPLERTNACRPMPQINSTVDGLPAYANGRGVWEFESGNAAFQVTVNIPLKPQYGDTLTRQGTPIPAVTSPVPAEAQANAILNSIQVTDRHSLCK